MRLILAGNVATYEGARELIALGVDGIKVGIGPGSDLHHARRFSGAGVPQITAIARVRAATREARAYRSSPMAASSFPETLPRPSPRAPTA